MGDLYENLKMSSRRQAVLAHNGWTQIFYLAYQMLVKSCVTGIFKKKAPFAEKIGAKVVFKSG